jgi:hypothetical protein
MDEQLKQITKEGVGIAVALLEQMLSGKVDSGVALQQWPGGDVDDDPLLVATWHDLSHFAADDDIRRKDRAYAEYQTELLSRRGQQIRSKFRLGTANG